MKIAINGFGRIGRTFLRTLFQDEQALSSLEVAAINIGPAAADDVAHFFKYDSIMGTFPGNITYTDGMLHINNKYHIPIITELDPAKLNWQKYQIVWVVDASGAFTTRERALLHQTAGAKKVLITAPMHGEDITIIPGVNSDSYNPDKHNIVSLGSCTTNCFAPVIAVLHKHFTITSGLMTTAHAYTNTQVLLDVEEDDLRRSRAAAINIVPTKTGASSMIKALFPDLATVIKAHAIRVPVPIVSLLDFSFCTKKNPSSDDINAAFIQESKNALDGILDCCAIPLVSSDFKGNAHSAIIDTELTTTVAGMSKVYAWYDNEWGYSMRLKDFLLHNCS